MAAYTNHTTTIRWGKNMASATAAADEPPLVALAVLRRGRRKAPPDLQWRMLAPYPSETSSIVVSVVKEDASLHPWAGTGHKRKYALNGLQGVHLWLQAGAVYHFDAGSVPKSHPFHFTLDAMGGKKSRPGSALSPAVMSATFPVPSLAYRPSDANEAAHHFYQCAVHPFMGGPVTVFLPGTSVAFIDEAQQRVVLREDATGDFLLVNSSGDNKGAESQRFLTLMGVMEECGVVLADRPSYLLGRTINGDKPDVFIYTLSDTSDASTEDDSPSVLVRHDSKLYCEHVHSLSHLRSWVSERTYDSEEPLCPSCSA